MTGVFWSASKYLGITLSSGIEYFSILNYFFYGILSRYRKVDTLDLTCANSSFGGYIFLTSSINTTFCFYFGFGRVTSLGISLLVSLGAYFFAILACSFIAFFAFSSKPCMIQYFTTSMSLSISRSKKEGMAFVLYCILINYWILSLSFAKK